MTKLTTEITIEELQYRIHAHENDLTQMWTADYFLNVQKELLALKQAAKNSADLKTLVISEIVDFYAGFESPCEPETVDEAQRQLIGRIEKVFGLAAPVLPKQPEPVAWRFDELAAKGMVVTVYKSVANSWIARGFKATPLFELAPAQPVIPEQPKPTISFYRDGIIAAAKWVENQRDAYDNEHSQSDPDTGAFEFGNDAQLEYSTTLSEIAEGIRSLHPTSAQPVSEPRTVGYFSYGTAHGFNLHQTAKQATDDAEAMIDDYRGDACCGWDEETDSICWGVILQQATKVDERPRTDDDAHLDPRVDTVCDYALLPAQESE